MSRLNCETTVLSVKRMPTLNEARIMCVYPTNVFYYIYGNMKTAIEMVRKFNNPEEYLLTTMVKDIKSNKQEIGCFIRAVFKNGPVSIATIAANYKIKNYTSVLEAARINAKRNMEKDKENKALFNSRSVSEVLYSNSYTMRVMYVGETNERVHQGVIDYCWTDIMDNKLIIHTKEHGMFYYTTLEEYMKSWDMINEMHNTIYQ